MCTDDETTDISFRVEVTDASETPSTELGEVFNAHKLVLETCAKGSILASQCENYDGSEPILIKGIHPEVFHLLLWYIFGGKLSSAEWENHGKDLIEKPQT